MCVCTYVLCMRVCMCVCPVHPLYVYLHGAQLQALMELTDELYRFCSCAGLSLCGVTLPRAALSDWGVVGEFGERKGGCRCPPALQAASAPCSPPQAVSASKGTWPPSGLAGDRHLALCHPEGQVEGEALPLPLPSAFSPRFLPLALHHGKAVPAGLGALIRPRVGGLGETGWF